MKIQQPEFAVFSQLFVEDHIFLTILQPEIMQTMLELCIFPFGGKKRKRKSKLKNSLSIYILGELVSTKYILYLQVLVLQFAASMLTGL